MSERVLTLEINFKNFMEQVLEKLDYITEKVEDMPRVYATKDEVAAVNNKLNMIDWGKVATKTEWIKTWWVILVATISFVGNLVLALLK